MWKAPITIAAIVLSMAACSGPTDSGTSGQNASSNRTDSDVQSAFLHWRLPPGAEQYADIDGRPMLEDVMAQA